MTDDATADEIPPGLREEYLDGVRAQLAKFVRLAERLETSRADREALEQLRRETHKIHGSAGSYGFWKASRLAAGMEETAKDWASRPDDSDVDRGSLTRWFLGRLAELMTLEAPPTRRADRTTGPLEVGPRQVPEVILVEDDPSLGDLLEYGLRSRGYRFASHANGRQALTHLLALDTGGAHPLLLLDVDLPELDGYAICEALQRERPGVYRVVFTTVHGEERERLRGLAAGALDYVVKPISLRVLMEKVRAWAGR